MHSDQQTQFDWASPLLGMSQLCATSTPLSPSSAFRQRISGSSTLKLGCRAPLQKEQGSLCPFRTGKPKQSRVKGFLVTLWMQKLLVGQQPLYLHAPRVCWTRQLLVQPGVPL